MKHYFTFPLLVIFVVGGCGTSTSMPSIATEYDEQEMDEAIAHARREVDSFISELTNPTGTNHSVKAPIEDGDQIEHFWLSDLSYSDGIFSGTINNDPELVSNIQFGQSWSIGKAEISDWMFTRNDKIHGNFTMRPLLKSMPEEEAKIYRAMLAEP